MPNPRSGQPNHRPSLLNANRIDTILTAIENGHFTETAATLAGVSRRTYNAWKVRGENELRRVEALGVDAGEIVDQFLAEEWDESKPFRGLIELLKSSWADPAFDTNEWPYVIFSVLLAKARATFIDKELAEIRRIGSGLGNATAPNWGAHKWLLQVTQPDKYGAKSTITHEGGENPITFDIPTPEKLRERLDQIRNENSKK